MGRWSAGGLAPLSTNAEPDLYINLVKLSRSTVVAWFPLQLRPVIRTTKSFPGPIGLINSVDLFSPNVLNEVQTPAVYFSQVSRRTIFYFQNVISDAKFPKFWSSPLPLLCIFCLWTFQCDQLRTEVVYFPSVLHFCHFWIVAQTTNSLVCFPGDVQFQARKNATLVIYSWSLRSSPSWLQTSDEQQPDGKVKDGEYFPRSAVGSAIFGHAMQWRAAGDQAFSQYVSVGIYDRPRHSVQTNKTRQFSEEHFSATCQGKSLLHKSMATHWNEGAVRALQRVKNR